MELSKIKSIKKIHNNSLLYDIEIKDNNNFFANGILVHNCSATYWYRKKRFKSEFGVCSRTVRKFEMDNSNWSKAARELEIKKKLISVGKNIAIQGELGSTKVQGNKYGLEGFKLFVFDVFDIDEKRYYNLEEMIEFCKNYGFDMVPILDKNFHLLDDIDDMVKLSNGQSVLPYRTKETLREGIVVRSINNDRNKSFKVVSPEFLLKNGE